MPRGKNHKDYPKMGVNFERNNMIYQTWQKNPTRKLSDIAKIYSVSVRTVYNVIHKKIEFDNPIYNALARTNESLQYTQAVVTRSFIAIRRWYPDIRTEADLANLTIGSDIDNNARFTRACEKLISATIDSLTN